MKKSIPSSLVIVLLICSGLLLTGNSTIFGVGGSKDKLNKIKKEIAVEIDRLENELSQGAQTIWNYAETALKENKSSAFLASMLEKYGFKVDMGAGGLATAFVATWGSGQPRIGFLAEFDALPGLSQKSGLANQEAVSQGEPGHGCGHNLLGVGSAGAVIALKKVMEKYQIKGTIMLFGCPAEETVTGKVYMARAGIFNDLDICFDWHPSDKNEVSLETSNALNNFEVIFQGRTSHAAGDPWEGRSALDAIELLNHGINYLREHVKPTVRMHYVILEGGRAPNIVPDQCRGWYYVRGKDRPEVEEVYKRVLDIIRGAALMTGTKPEVRLNTGVYNYLKNKRVAGLLYKNLKQVGVPRFSDPEQEYARRMQKNIEKKEEGMSTKIEPFEDKGGYWGGGSTDAADVSWIVPTASLNVACWPDEVPGHSWCVTSATGFSVGIKGMLIASKILAGSALEAIFDPAVIKEARKEFKDKTKDFTYKSALDSEQGKL